MKNNTKVVIYDEENGMLRTEKFMLINGENLETDVSCYPVSNAYKYYNETDGFIYYYLNVPLPAKLEAENVKHLRRNAALNNIFNYQTKKSFDLIAFMPWVIVMLLIFFM